MNPYDLSLRITQGFAVVGDLHVDNRTPISRIDNIMETMDKKLRSILSSCKSHNVRYVFFEGDLINRVSMTFEALNLAIQVFMEFRRQGIQLFSILGNHDIVRNSTDKLDKSPVQILFTMGLITHINLESPVYFHLSDFYGNSASGMKVAKLTAVDYTEEPVQAESGMFNILLAHMFYNADPIIAEKVHNLLPEEISGLNYDLIFLGHDHECYPDEVVGKTRIIRDGSVLRGTSHNYNMTRTPQFSIVTLVGIELGGDTASRFEVEKVEIEHLPYKDIASEYALTKKSGSDTLEGLQDILSGLADRLVSLKTDDGDRIYEIIQSDQSLDPECRSLILKYVQESA